MTRLWPEGEAVKTWEGKEMLSGFVWKGASHQILRICSRWRLHTRWWDSDKAIWREYIKVTTDGGLLCLLYRDLYAGDWFLARIYD
jgi:hypothetical protein